MNKKANVMIGLSLGLFIWISGILLIVYFGDVITEQRSNLSCSDTSISYGNKGTCLILSGLMPYYIWTIASISLALLIGGFKPNG